jgi:hypothetical protein
VAVDNTLAITISGGTYRALMLSSLLTPSAPQTPHHPTAEVVKGSSTQQDGGRLNMGRACGYALERGPWGSRDVGVQT